MSLTSDIGTFLADVSLRSLPDHVTEKARTCLLYGYGIGLACHNKPSVRVARSVALSLEGASPKGATLLAHGGKVSLPGAALANAVLFQGRGQEDTCGAAHLGAILIPTLTALFEARQLPIERFIPALVAGYEMGGLLEDAYAQFSTSRGFRSSSLYGPMAAAAAAARAMELPADRIAAAIGNAASLSGGIVQSFVDGTDEWRYQVGVAGRTGLVAAELAMAGSVSAPHAIEGKSGFVRSFAQLECDTDAISSRLGRDWSIHRVFFKPFPVCASNQTPVTAALDLKQKLAGREIKSIRVRINPYDMGGSGATALKGPFDTIAGTGVSIPFCIALALLRGEPTTTTLSNFNDAEVNALAQHIDLIADEKVARLCCVIDAELAGCESLIIEKIVTTEHYNYDRSTASRLTRRIGAEEEVPAKAFDLIERFATALPRADIGDVIDAFALCPTAS